MNMYRGVEVQLHAFLIQVWDTMSGQIHAPRVLPSEKVSGTHAIEGWMGPWANTPFKAPAGNWTLVVHG
jgi:hypothetical protein